MEEQKKPIKINLKTFILALILLSVAIIGTVYAVSVYLNNKPQNYADKTSVTNTSLNTNVVEKDDEDDEFVVKEVNFDVAKEFDYAFLKLENRKKNKVYSPLSIKYALKMLEEASDGETKNQISKLLENKTLTKYKTNNNLSLANSLFVRDSFKNQIKESYINTLKNKYNAELRFDSFENSKNINDWINEKTFEIIPQIVSDDDVQELDFALINALAIDMEWEEKFIYEHNSKSDILLQYLHEQRHLEEYDSKKDITVYCTEHVSPNLFNKESKEIKVSGMNIDATINNYDIINELGKENIKKIVSDEYRKFAKKEEYDGEHVIGDFPLSEDVSDEGIEKALKEFLPSYISELNSNYHKLGASTDFSIYVDDEVKVFAKDLKEYNGTTLQYIGIMPTSIELDKFIDNIDSAKISNYISNLKDINYKNFKEGVVTRIYGYIPKFKFEYDLNLMEDLKLCDVTDVFDKGNADLSNMIEGDAYISKVLHKANIEFTQDGITAAAATYVAGAGAGMPFDYIFDVPVEEIDMTFDKPYMFLIIDKETKETFFVGSVYEPLLWDEEPGKF